MDMAELYYVSRKLRTWAESAVVPAGFAENVPLYQWVVLREIIQTPNTTVQELAQRFSLAQSMVSKVVADAKERDLLVTTVDQQDRRKIRLTPSEKLLTSLEPGLSRDVDEAIENLVHTLSPDDQAAIKRAFVLLYQVFKQREEQNE